MSNRLINLIKGDLLKRNSDGYDVSNGDRSFQILNSKKTPFSLQVIWSSLNNTDAVVKIYGSNDGSTFDLLPGTSSKTMTTASGSYSFVKDEFNWEYIALELTVNSVTSGTLKAILEIKD